MFSDAARGNWVRFERTFEQGLRFSCTRCGACCRHVGGEGIGLREKDAQRLREINSSLKKTSHPIFSRRLESSNGVCSYLSESTPECEIYSKRPLVCRLYPFYLSVSGDGSIQLSVDHCPGVNSTGSEIVDDRYIEREILPALLDDVEFVGAIKDRIQYLKGSSYALVPAVKITISWQARLLLWNELLELTQPAAGPHFSPRDMLEVLRADIVPIIEGALIAQFSSSSLGDSGVEKFFLDNREQFELVVLRSIKIQTEHRAKIQREGTLLVAVSPSVSHRDYIVFRKRSGESFSVPSGDILRMREFEPGAISAELEYLREVIRREFVYSGIAVEPLSLRQETALLFYLADAVELTANALAVWGKRETIDSTLIVQAICIVDATVLNTVLAIGGKIAAIQ